MVRTLLRLGGGAAATALATLRELGSADRLGTAPVVRATGIAALDDVLHGGIHPGELVLLAGKPGNGKTATALHWARSMALSGWTCLYASYEHDRPALLARLLEAELERAASARPEGIDLDELRARLRDVAAGAVGPQEALASDPLLVEVADRLTAYADSLVLLAASAVHTDVATLAAHIGEEAPGAGAVVFVDTIERVPVPGDPADRDERIRRVLEGLKDLALSHGVAVVGVMCTGTRGLCARRLGLEHLVAPATVASVADTIVLLNRSPEAPGVWPDCLTVAKNRNGPAGIDVPFPLGPLD